MWKTTLRSIGAHKRRLLATCSAVVLGVAFLSGTLVLGDTMQTGFGDMFSEANAGTDAVDRKHRRAARRVVEIQRLHQQQLGPLELAVLLCRDDGSDHTGDQHQWLICLVELQISDCRLQIEFQIANQSAINLKSAI